MVGYLQLSQDSRYHAKATMTMTKDWNARQLFCGSDRAISTHTKFQISLLEFRMIQNGLEYGNIHLEY